MTTPRALGRTGTALAASVAAVLVGGVAYAASANLQVAKVGANSAAVPHCDSSPGSWSLTFNETGSNVTSVTVSGINSACNTKTLQLALRQGSAAPAAGASGSATITSGSVTVTLGSAQAYNSFDHEDLVILG